MTQQSPDYVCADGQLLRLTWGFPLHDLLRRLDLSPGPEASEGIRSSCWRGHVAVWGLADGALFLIDVRDDKSPQTSVRWLEEQEQVSLYELLNLPVEPDDPDDLPELLPMTPQQVDDAVQWLGGKRQSPLRAVWIPDWKSDLIRSIGLKPLNSFCEPLQSSDWHRTFLGDDFLRSLQDSGWLAHPAPHDPAQRSSGDP